MTMKKSIDGGKTGGGGNECLTLETFQQHRYRCGHLAPPGGKNNIDGFTVQFAGFTLIASFPRV
jgi:hypothetical protein